MLKLNTILVLLTLAAACYCQTHGITHTNRYTIIRKKKPHKHHLFHHWIYHSLYYFAFFALKIKFVFVVGTLVALILSIGKIIAFIKYLQGKNHHHHEEIIYEKEPSFHHHNPYDFAKRNSYSTLQKPLNFPLPQEIYVDSYRPKSRAMEAKPFLESFQDLFKRFNVTEMTFKSMGFNSEECKKRLVCEADSNKKHSKIMETVIEVLNDEELDKYRMESGVKGEDCMKKYPCSKIDKGEEQE